MNDFYSDRIEEAVIIQHALRHHVEQMVRRLLARVHSPPCIASARGDSRATIVRCATIRPCSRWWQIQHGSTLEQRTACQRSLVSIHFNLLMLQNYVALNFTGIVKVGQLLPTGMACVHVHAHASPECVQLRMTMTNAHIHSPAHIHAHIQRR